MEALLCCLVNPVRSCSACKTSWCYDCYAAMLNSQNGHDIGTCVNCIKNT